MMSPLKRAGLATLIFSGGALAVFGAMFIKAQLGGNNEGLFLVAVLLILLCLALAFISFFVWLTLFIAQKADGHISGTHQLYIAAWTLVGLAALYSLFNHYNIGQNSRGQDGLWMMFLSAAPLIALIFSLYVGARGVAIAGPLAQKLHPALLFVAGLVLYFLK